MKQRNESAGNIHFLYFLRFIYLLFNNILMDVYFVASLFYWFIITPISLDYPTINPHAFIPSLLGISITLFRVLSLFLLARSMNLPDGFNKKFLYKFDRHPLEGVSFQYRTMLNAPGYKKDEVILSITAFLILFIFFLMELISFLVFSQGISLYFLLIPLCFTFMISHFYCLFLRDKVEKIIFLAIYIGIIGLCLYFGLVSEISQNPTFPPLSLLAPLCLVLLVWYGFIPYTASLCDAPSVRQRIAIMISGVFLPTLPLLISGFLFMAKKLGLSITFVGIFAPLWVYLMALVAS